MSFNFLILCSACHVVPVIVVGVLVPVSAVVKVSAAWLAPQKRSAVWRKIFFLLHVKCLVKRAVMKDAALLLGSAVTQVSFTCFLSSSYRGVKCMSDFT